MKCPMKFSAGCSSESKECEGSECMWYISTETRLSEKTGETKVVYGCAVAFAAVHGVSGNMSYNINA